ncbi:hypothetical protein I302_105555 [Kwoniella bestiolae CBS 10118]|uniref:Alcohol acetyltransferase n=1 Tax=Kwoniella bestiolae CBS 10118 TaxID=1296100 RepID=A0A1B9FTF5_9TREE|nr:hypothetical protein I302_08838 [Kwoniella bestiolae CBS 10118]OCF22057.1 hypothetical protein I302_08838 [Kwoniella bestiolae CBS 10118]
MVRETPVLGLSERWSLSRNNVGSPITVVYHASLPAGLVSKHDLETAVTELCNAYPILVCGVEKKDSKHPKYAFRKDINPQDVVKVIDLVSEDSLSDMVDKAVVRGKSFDVSCGPLWELQLHRYSSSAKQPSRDRIVLLIDHVLCDGLGARNLFTNLLDILSGTSVPKQPEDLPSRMDDTVDLRPSSGMNVPSIPSTVATQLNAITKSFTSSSSPQQYDKFPPKPSPEYNSITAPQQFSELELLHSELAGLLSEGKKHGIPTIHPVIHIACLVALYRAIRPLAAWSFYTSIPISERREDLGHPHATGNYVTFHFSTDQISTSTPFWEHVRGFSSTLRQPETKILARKAMGKLASIDKDQSEGSAESLWADYLMRMVNDPSGPHKLSLAVSNVGIMDIPTSGKLSGMVKDVYFTQGASAMGGCAVISIVSTRGGSMTVSLSSKIGSLPPGVFESFSQQLKPMLQAVARGDIGEETVAGDSIPGLE